MGGRSRDIGGEEMAAGGKFFPVEGRKGMGA